MKKFIVTLKRSLISCSKDQKATVECLGLKKINQKVEILDNPANRGQLYKVQHLVDVQVVK